MISQDIQVFLDEIAEGDEGSPYEAQSKGISDMHFDRGTLTDKQLTAVFASAGRQGKQVPEELRAMKRGRKKTPEASQVPEPATWTPSQQKVELAQQFMHQTGQTQTLAEFLKHQDELQAIASQPKAAKPTTDQIIAALLLEMAENLMAAAKLLKE